MKINYHHNATNQPDTLKRQFLIKGIETKAIDVLGYGKLVTFVAEYVKDFELPEFLSCCSDTNSKMSFETIILEILKMKPEKCNQILETAFISGSVELLEGIYQNNNLISDFKSKLYCSTRRGMTEIIQVFLQKEQRIDSTHLNKVLKIAAEEGYFDIVRLLLKDKRVDPSSNNNYLLQKSVYYGEVDLLKQILTLENIDPTVNNHYALKTAVSFDHLEIVEVLIKDKRVNYREMFEMLENLIKSKEMRSLLTWKEITMEEGKNAKFNSEEVIRIKSVLNLQSRFPTSLLTTTNSYLPTTIPFKKWELNKK